MEASGRKNAYFRLILGDYEYNSVEEIGKDHEPTSSLEIKTRDPFPAIDLYQHSAILRCMDSSIGSVGAVSKIEQVIRRCVRRWRYFGGPNNVVPSLFLSFVALVSVAGLTAFAYGQNLLGTSRPALILAAALFVLYLVWAFLQFRWSSHSFSQIHFVERRHRTSFWSRKRDDLLADLVKGGLGFVLGLIAHKIFDL